MAELNFNQTGFWAKQFALTATDGRQLGSLERRAKGSGVAKLGDRVIEFVRPSWLSSQLELRTPGQPTFATYGPETGERSPRQWLKRLMASAGTIQLDGQTYRFVQSGGWFSDEYRWCTAEQPDVALVTYHYQAFTWNLKAKGTVQTVAQLSEKHAAVLVPLGLFVLLGRQDDSAAGAGSSAAVMGG